MHGVIAQQLGKTSEAHASLTAALAIEPGNAMIATLLTRVGSAEFATAPDDN